MMTEGLLFLTVLLGFGPTEDPHWNKSPGALLITSTSFWRVNRAKPVQTESVIAHFAKAKLSTHKEREGLSVWVFDEDIAADKKRKNDAMIRLKPEEGKSGLDVVVGEAELLEKLAALQVKLPKDNATMEKLGQVSGLVAAAADKNAKLKQWFLLASSGVPNRDQANPAPPKGKGNGEGQEAEKPKVDEAPAKVKGIAMRDESVLIEWGHPDVIKAVVDSLQKREKGQPVKTEDGKPVYDEAVIFERHAYKVPLQAEVFLSPASDPVDKAAESVHVSKTIYAISSKAPRTAQPVVAAKKDDPEKPAEPAEPPGYLAFLSSAEPGKVSLIGLQVTKFEAASGEVTIEVPAECFLSKIVNPPLDANKKVSLPPINAKSASETLFLAKDPKTNAEKWMLRLKGPLTLPAPVVTGVAATDKAAADAITKADTLRSRVLLDGPDDTDSYSLVVSRAPDVEVPVEDDTPIVVYDDSCNKKK